MLAPVRVSVPLPALVSPPLPEIAVASTTSLPLVSNVPPLPPIAASRGERSAVLPAAHCTPPPSRVILPVPKLPSVVKLIRPSVIVVPPP